MSRAQILERIRRACGGAPPPPIPASLPVFGRISDRISRFGLELEKVGGFFWDARGGGSRVAQTLARILKETGTREIYWETPEVLEKHGLPYGRSKGVPAEGPVLWYSSHPYGAVTLPLALEVLPYSRVRLAEVPLSASSAAAGLADTGTVVHALRAGTGRLLSVLPLAHIAMLREEDLLSNQAEFFTRYSPGEQSSATTLVTGPSRTADIEKTLVLGVHGPRYWHVVLTG